MTWKDVYPKNFVIRLYIIHMKEVKIVSKMNTINETAKLCKENQIGISRNHIRYLAVNGLIPSVKIGNKILINWEQLMNYLDTNTLNTSQDCSGIRKITA